MAAFETRQEFQLRLQTEELRLVLKALGGRLRPEDIEPAKRLGDELSVQKAKSLTHLAHENAKLVESLQRAGLWSPKAE